MVLHADFEFYNENAELHDKDMICKQNTFLYQNFMIRAISPSSRYVVEGFVLRHLDKFRALYNRFKPIL